MRSKADKLAEANSSDDPRERDLKARFCFDPATHLAEIAWCIGSARQNKIDMFGLQPLNKILNLRARNNRAMGGGGRGGVQGLGQTTSKLRKRLLLMQLSNVRCQRMGALFAKQLFHYRSITIPLLSITANCGRLRSIAGLLRSIME